MSDLRSADIDKPWWLSISPMRRHFPRSVLALGWHAEGDLGALALPDGELRSLDLPRDPLGLLLHELHEVRAHREGVIVLWAFDLHRQLAILLRRAPRDVVTLPEWRLEVRVGPLVAHLHGRGERSLTITFGAGRRPIHLYDVAAFFTSGFADAARIVTDEPLLPRAAGSIAVDQRARIVRGLGEEIVGYHRVADVPLSPSAPALAARLFKRRFLGVDIPLLERDVEDAALACFRGGKVGAYGAPLHLERAYLLDLVSAYPAALAQLPDPTRSRWTMASGYRPGVHALWWVQIHAPACRYGFAHDRRGRWIRDKAGAWEGWMTSYELDAALDEHPDLRLERAHGWVLDGPSGGPFAEFAAQLFAAKRNAPTTSERGLAKLELNALIGKLAQRRAATDDDEARWLVDDAGVHEIPRRFVAGGLWHPDFAALVNGWVRAKMHQLEHRYQAVATSVDAILTAERPDPADTGDGLGQLAVSEGELWLWRERLYLFKGRHGARDHVSLHGFYGTVEQLRRVPLADGVYRYSAERFVGLRQASGHQEPGSIVRAGFRLILGPGPPI